MKVLMISGDRHVLDPSSSAYVRLELQRSRVAQLDVFVWPQVHSWRDISKVAKMNAYDVVTVQDPFWRGFLGWRIARRFGARLHVQVHTDLTAHSFARRMLARFVLQRADSVRVVSEKIKKQVEDMHIHVPIHVVPIFVDVDRFRMGERKSSERKTLLWIGRFEAEKDPLSAVSVLTHVRSAGIDARLIMLGTGSKERELRQRAHGLPVEFPGWQDPKQYLETADVVIVTSTHESWGASIVEALAARVPVVSPDVGIAREAGAIVVPRSEIGSAVIDVLQSGIHGVLKLPLLNAAEWAREWRKTLI